MSNFTYYYNGGKAIITDPKQFLYNKTSKRDNMQGTRLGNIVKIVVHIPFSKNRRFVIYYFDNGNKLDGNCFYDYYVPSGFEIVDKHTIGYDTPTTKFVYKRV